VLSKVELNLTNVGEEIALQVGVETAYDKVEQMQSLVTVAEEVFEGESRGSPRERFLAGQHKGGQASPRCIIELASCCGAEGMPLQFWITMRCESQQPLYSPGC
jgi:hypothetical protein